MTSQPYYGPDESAYDILMEQMFVAADFIVGVGYGVQLVLYTSCALYIWRTRASKGRQAFILVTYMTLLLLIETVFCIVQARSVQLMYIDNRNYPGGPWQYFLATQNLPINVMFFALLFVLTFLADLLILWRCWVIYSGSGRGVAILVIIFPTIILLASFVMGTLWTLQSSQPGLSMYSALPMAYGTSYYIISLSVNILLTVLITARLLIYRRRACSASAGGIVSDKGRVYMSLATVFVESAGLYSAAALVFIVTYAVNNPANQVFLGVASAAQQIAGYLIIYRVAQGRAWSQNTTAPSSHPSASSSFSTPRSHFDAEKGKLSQLRFASSTRLTQTQFSAVSTSPTSMTGTTLTSALGSRIDVSSIPLAPMPTRLRTTSVAGSSSVGSIFVEEFESDEGHGDDVKTAMEVVAEGTSMNVVDENHGNVIEISADNSV